jgi:hypothetical protein
MDVWSLYATTIHLLPTIDFPRKGWQTSQPDDYDITWAVHQSRSMLGPNLAFMAPMARIDPANRASAAQILLSGFADKGGLSSERSSIEPIEPESAVNMPHPSAPVKVARPPSRFFKPVPGAIKFPDKACQALRVQRKRAARPGPSKDPLAPTNAGVTKQTYPSAKYAIKTGALGRRPGDPLVNPHGTVQPPIGGILLNPILLQRHRQRVANTRPAQATPQQQQVPPKDGLDGAAKDMNSLALGRKRSNKRAKEAGTAADGARRSSRGRQGEPSSRPPAKTVAEKAVEAPVDHAGLQNSSSFSLYRKIPGAWVSSTPASSNGDM